MAKRKRKRGWQNRLQKGQMTTRLYNQPAPPPKSSFFPLLSFLSTDKVGTSEGVAFAIALGFANLEGEEGRCKMFLELAKGEECADRAKSSFF